jgi:hypothetical protein
MKIVARLLLFGPDRFDLFMLEPWVRPEFEYEEARVGADLVAGHKYFALFEGRLHLDEPLYEWAREMVHGIWRASGHFLSAKVTSHRLLDDAKVYPRYVHHVFDDEGEYDAMKIGDELASRNVWPELEPHIIDQELNVLASPTKTVRAAIESFFTPGEKKARNQQRK